MLFPPVSSEGRTADIYRGLVLSLEFSVPDHFSMDRFALRDAGLFSGYISLLIQKPCTLMIFDRHANLKYKYGSRHFWCRGYYVDTVGKNAKVIADYIKNQLEEDYMSDQMTMKEYTDPFTGSKNNKA